MIQGQWGPAGCGLSKLLDAKGTRPVPGFVGRMCTGGLWAAALTVPEQVGQLQWAGQRATSKAHCAQLQTRSLAQTAEEQQRRRQRRGRDNKRTPSALEGRVG